MGENLEPKKKTSRDDPKALRTSALAAGLSAAIAGGALATHEMNKPEITHEEKLRAALPLNSASEFIEHIQLQAEKGVLSDRDIVATASRYVFGDPSSEGYEGAPSPEKAVEKLTKALGEAALHGGVDERVARALRRMKKMYEDRIDKQKPDEPQIASLQ